MKCPSCSKNLAALPAGDIQVDACTGSCGGVWFDSRELDKFDEPHEFETHEILQLAKRTESVKVDGRKLKHCPKCAKEPLVRQFIDPKNEVVIDQCWHCGGIWLDVGEINQIRSQYSSMKERAAAVNAYVDGAVGRAKKELELDTKAQMARYNDQTRNRFKGAIRAMKELLGLESPFPD